MRRVDLAWLCAVATLAGGCATASATASATAPAAPPAAPTAGAAHAGHSSWSAVRSGTRQTLFDVACLTASRCEAVGAAGTILGTSNGGRSWRTQRSGTSADVYRIACAWPGSCYAIARPATILVTHNAGWSWQSRTLRIPGVGTATTAPGCSMPTTAPGPAVPCQVGLLDISCPSALVCYAVATSPAGYSTLSRPRGSTVWITRDGGAHWKRQSLPPTVPCAIGDCAGGFAYPLTWVTCLSTGLCRMGGELFLGCGRCGVLYTVFSTTGPWAPWTLLGCLRRGMCGNGYSPDAAACPTAARCYGVTSLMPFDGDNGIFWSDDGGATWPGAVTGVHPLQYDVACASGQVCETAGGSGSLFRTTNGGRFAPDRGPSRQDLHGITCVTSDVCYAVGGNGAILVRH
ncbi:MAG TPA: YCF48-related protein [Streptosporangiaceae bacterium]|nr:YCF48-related protein [Streptosporangiaceae bacterium]